MLTLSAKVDANIACEATLSEPVAARPSSHEVASQERHCSHGRLALQYQARMALAVRQVGDLLGQLASGVQLGLSDMKPMEALEDLEELRRLPHLVTQRVSPGVDLTHFQSRRSLGGDEQSPQAELQREFALHPLGALRQGRQQRQPFPQRGERFGIGMAPPGILPPLLPMVHGTLDLASALEVDR